MQLSGAASALSLRQSCSMALAKLLVSRFRLDGAGGKLRFGAADGCLPCHRPDRVWDGLGRPRPCLPSGIRALNRNSGSLPDVIRVAFISTILARPMEGHGRRWI